METKTLEELTNELKSRGWQIKIRNGVWYGNKRANKATLRGEESFKQWALTQLGGLRRA